LKLLGLTLIDDIWQKYSKDSRTEFACFSFYVGLLVITLSSLRDTVYHQVNSFSRIKLARCVTHWSFTRYNSQH